MGTKSRETI
jgi:hypothetical protein